MPGGAVKGQLLETDEVDALDRYEGVDEGLYIRVTIPRAPDDPAGDSPVQTYIGNPARLGLGEEVWPGTGSFRERVRSYIDERHVVWREIDHE